MRPQYLDIRVSPRKGSEPSYPLTLSTPLRRLRHLRFFPPSPLFELGATAPAGAARLAEGLLGPEAIAFIEEEKPNLSKAQLRIEVIPRELVPLPWEDLVTVQPFASIPNLQTLRFSRFPARLAQVPFEMPLDVLSAALGDSSLEPTSIKAVPESVLRYFAAIITNRATPGELADLLRNRSFEIVHLRGVAFRDQGGEVVFGSGLPGDGIGARRLRTLLTRSGVRFLILEGPMHPELMELAHLMQARGGPTTLVLSMPKDESSAAFLQEIFLGIVHNSPLDEAVAEAKRKSPSVAVSCFISPGGEEVVLLSRQHSWLAAKHEFHRVAAERSLQELRSLTLGSYELSPGHRFALETAPGEIQTALQEFATINPNFLHETDGMIPMTKVAGALRQATRVLSETSRYLDRVINVWLTEGEELVGTNRSLRLGNTYELHLQVGRAAERSILRDAPALAEEALTPFYSDGGLTLRVVLFSEDFELDPDELPLELPLPPGESDEVRFSIRPTKAGNRRLRVGVYFSNNLLQSILIHIPVDSKEMPVEAPLIQAEIEFALLSSLEGVEEFQPRALNILTNDDADGHTFAIVGTNLKPQVPLGEDQMRKTMGLARRTLQSICSTLDGNGSPTSYRFKPDNSGKEADFAAGMIDLAWVGYQMYVHLVTGGRDDIREPVDSALSAPKQTIQVAITKSASYVFPWAMVYDHPLHQDKDNRLCPTFAADLRKGGPPHFLEKQVCLAQACPNREDRSVVCPSGFWGFRHIIEQPLPIVPSGPGVLSKAVHEIGYGDKVSLVMAVSEELGTCKAHAAEIEQWASVASQVVSDTVDIEKCVRSSAIHTVYFYCHGGRSDVTPWLGVGTKAKRGKIYPSDFSMTWKISWPSVHPLVFINGCETVGLLPDDLLQFNSSLSRCQAAGVIGTEIVIPEQLGKYFGARILEAFVEGEQIGDIVRRARLELLERCNPLGLAYTPYCVADLHMVKTQSN